MMAENKPNTPAAGQAPVKRERTIHPCNFRYAGRVSNENARALSALHEKFALNVNTALGLYLGASLHLKLVFLDQVSLRDYVQGIEPLTYLLPCALSVMDTNILIDMDISLAYPMIDLLLGGPGATSAELRELSEIDEELMQSVSNLMVKQLETTWQSLNVSLTPGRCIKSSSINQVFLANEKLVVLLFELTIGETTAPVKIVIPTSFVGFLLRYLKAAQSKKASGLRTMRGPSFRERLLNCDFVVAADIMHMKALVKDLVALKPGSVLKMNAPVRNPGNLTVDGIAIYEALPVRNGARKAAQLMTRVQESAALKELV